MYNTADYRPVFQRSNFQPAFGSGYVSHYMGQATPPAPAPTPTPTPAPATPAQKMSTPLVLGIGAGGGALVGYLLTLVMPKVDKRFPKGPGIKTSGALGGLIGGLLGAGTALLLKD